MPNGDMINNMYVDVLVYVYRCMILTSHLAVITDIRSSEKHHMIYIMVNVFSPSAPTFVPTSAPTSAPTFVPTSAPTLIPTVSPTVFIASTLPIVSYLSTASLSSTQITLTAHLSRVHTAPNDFSGETLYCIGMNNGSAPSTIGSIKSAATDGSTSYGATAIIPGKSSYPLNLNVTFTGLVALQSYAVYCYVESSTGVGSSLTAVLSSKTVVRTLCCKVFKYLNSPSSMYGAYSKRIGSSPSLYVFTYTLSAAPSVAIKVTPLLYLNSLINTEVTAIPSSAVYSSTSLLTGSFILLANANINGSFVIVLSAGGSSAAEYYNHSITLQILSSVSPLPAPAMKSCQFSDSGQAVVVTFNTPTDSAGIATATWPCSNLFSFISASLTTCSWTTVATVTMTFNIKSGNIYLAPGGTVTVLGGLLRSFCSYNAVTCAQNDPSPSANLITMAPNIPTTPVVVLNSPVSLGSCANLVLDATASYGNGGRPYTSIQWIVSARSSAASIDTTTISTYLNSFSSRYQVSTPITILAQNLTKASYMITLNLRNFLGMTSFATVTITVITDSNLPSLSIIGPSYRTMVASSPLKVLSVATLSSCASGALPVIFVWTVKEGNRTAITNIKSSSLDPSIFAIPSYGLVVNNVYTVTVTALTHASTVNVSTTVYVAHGVVTAVIAGGTYRSAPVDKVLQLDATGSYDSDYPQTSSSMLTYQVQFNYQ